MKFSVSMPDEIVSKLDVLAKEIVCTRSGLITIAVRDYIQNQEAKKLLPALEAAMRSAASNRDLTEEEKRNLDAFALLSQAVQQKKN